MNKRSLIVNADDYGMAQPVNRGIIEAARGGALRATSAMTNAPGFDQAMQELASSGVALDVGLHATLTWGRPLLTSQEIPTLVDREGRFLKRIDLLGRALTGRISGDEVYCELRAQFERLSTKIPSISHVDGHHHCHVFPIIARAVERLAREFNVRFVRAPREGLWSPWSWASVRRLVVAALPASSPSYWRARGFRCPDHFGGFALGAGPKIEKRWRESIMRVPEGVCELMVHPGYYSGADLYDAGREQEVKILSDASLARRIADSGIEITTFTALPA